MQDKLKQDLTILEAMAAETAVYLNSDVLFWRLEGGNLPRLTLGGYLMRQHRLRHLKESFDPAEQARLETAVAQFNQAITEKVVRLEGKAHQEIEARIRQWGEYLKDLQQDGKAAAAANYATAVDTRAMLDALIHQLNQYPYQLQTRVQPQINLLDANLRRRWQLGDFVWSTTWQAAYPQNNYWWLYGTPH